MELVTKISGHDKTKTFITIIGINDSNDKL
jgi:hypothetical protein